MGTVNHIIIIINISKIMGQQVHLYPNKFMFHFCVLFTQEIKILAGLYPEREGGGGGGGKNPPPPPPHTHPTSQLLSQTFKLPPLTVHAVFYSTELCLIFQTLLAWKEYKCHKPCAP